MPVEPRGLCRDCTARGAMSSGARQFRTTLGRTALGCSALGWSDWMPLQGGIRVARIVYNRGRNHQPTYGRLWRCAADAPSARLSPGSHQGRFPVLEDISALMYSVSIWVLPAVTAITLHEAAHGWVAWKLGDDTAKRSGRVSFNPARHIDPFGTLVLPGILLMMQAPFLFGYAKPVPVNFARLRRPRRDMIWVAAAGPGINIAMAYLAAVLMYVTVLVPDVAAPWLFQNLKNALLLNVVLAAFNLLPLPPLDGSRVLLGLLPAGIAVRYARLERYGMAIIIGLLIVPPLIGTMIGMKLDLLPWLILTPVEILIDTILTLAGH